MTARQLLDTQNIFPIYTWQIFHTVPEKFMERYYIMLLSDEGVPYEPPIDIFDVQSQFPQADMYTLSNKIVELGVAITQHYDVQGTLRNVTNELRKDKKHLRWELIEVKYNVIDFYVDKSIVSRTSLGTYATDDENI